MTLILKFSKKNDKELGTKICKRGYVYSSSHFYSGTEWLKWQYNGIQQSCPYKIFSFTQEYLRKLSFLLMPKNSITLKNLPLSSSVLAAHFVYGIATQEIWIRVKRKVLVIKYCTLLYISYARHHNPLLIRNCSWILTICYIRTVFS